MGGNGPSAPRSLADDLRTRSDGELAALLRARPDLLTPVPVDIAQLASRATTRTSVVRALDRLDRFDLHVVDALAVLPETATPAAVQAALGVTAATADAAIERLWTKALAWGDKRSPHLVRAVYEALGPFPAGLGPPARQALMAHSPTRLARIATDLGLTTSGDPATDADAIATALTDDLDDLLTQLGDTPVVALRSLAAGPPTGTVDDARRDVDRASARTPVEHLLAVGLLVPVDDTTVVLPREIGLHLRGGIVRPGIAAGPPTPQITRHDPRTVDRTAGAGAFELVRRVETLLDTWEDAPPAVLRMGGLGVRDLRRLPPVLHLDEAGSALVADLAYAAGLVAPSSDFDEVWLPTPAADAWRRREPARQWTALATTWLATSRTPALVGTKDERDRPVPPLGHDIDRPLAPEIRRIVLSVLADLPAGAAPVPDGVLDAVRWTRPRRGGRLRDGLVRWTLREA
jgi:hypothetical protein